VRHRRADNRSPDAVVLVSSRDRNVAVEFKDLATAKACYQSPEYQNIRKPILLSFEG
jgi:uncharacterized protein (DUF1330 family)